MDFARKTTLELLSVFGSSLTLVLVGCAFNNIQKVTAGTQEIGLTALRQGLSRIRTPPETWLAGYRVASRDCLDAGVSKVFEKVYEGRVDGGLNWLVHVVVRIACCRAFAIKHLKYQCRDRRLNLSDDPMESVADELGRACISAVAVRPRSNAFRSFVGLQSGILGISIYEGNYIGAEVAKQIAIDDLTVRLRRANEQVRPKPSSEP